MFVIVLKMNHRSTAAQLLLLVCIYKCQTGTFESLHDHGSNFICEFTNSSSSLVIRNGYATTDVIDCLNRFKHAESLTFTDSGLKTIPYYLTILTKLVFLDLSNNAIKEAQFNAIERICGNLKFVILKFNVVHKLRVGNLDCLKSIERFHLANNTLSDIENGTFSVKLRMLKYLYLVNNELTVLDSSLYSAITLSKEAYITVNATRNKIGRFTNSIRLAIADISISNSLGLILTHNNFTSFDMKYYFDMFNVSNPLVLVNLGNSGFDLRFNPFKCDCSLYPLAVKLRQFYFMDPDNPVFSITCGSPLSLKGMMIRLVPSEQFNCSVVKQCPDTCSCTETIAINLITIKCDKKYQNNDLPERIPRQQQYVIDIKSDATTRLSSRNYLENTTVLDVSECSISDFESSIVNRLQRIRSVYLHDNQLKTLPRTFKHYNFSGRQLTLHGNPFNCDCHTLWMKQWLLSNKTYVDNKNRIICASGPGKGLPMIDVPDSRFVCQGKPLLTLNEILALALGSIVLLALFLTTITYNRTKIQIFMISKFDICKYCCRKRRRRSLVYDIFLPHSCEDDNFVMEIVNKLENHKPPYKICLGERNFEPGKTISENVLSFIEASHTTLLVVSNNFLQSSWCNMEFREAHMRFLRDQNIDMALVLLEELDPKLIFRELKFYMDTHVYIRYSDNLFWARLLQVLPIITLRDDITESSPLISN